MFKKVLIANRGEIALRIIHACRELGIETVAVHSTADQESLHVTYADEAVCIGPPTSSDSYLNVSSIIAAAEITGAEAVHPGYGFLAENPHFAEVLADCNLTWVGPSPSTMRLMGDKAMARKTAAKVGVPVLPGSTGSVSDAAEAARFAADVGYPIMLKAAAGGGGRGMRVVSVERELEDQLATAREEAMKSFGDGSLYLEKYLAEPRHVEIQVFGDREGNVIHLGERECSIQRRHQKLLEEAPSPALDVELREEMGAAAVSLAKAVSYENAGTVEFLLDRDGNYYFMEMNTRIQVEHPVTEMVTGIDLVKLQLQVAAGKPLGIAGGFTPRGHAIECRINAEDPESFRPSPGGMETFHPPFGPGIRVDSHAYEQYVVPPYYDSLVAKLITHDRTRREAIARMQRALDFFVIEGVETSIALHKRIIADPEFLAGNVSTRFMERLARREPAPVGEEGKG